MSRRLSLAAAVSSLALCAATAATADSVAYNAPNLISTVNPTSVTLNGSTFVNQGLVGTARLPANLHDFNGETLGSFSGMALDLKSWRRGANGAYTATLFTLPDRGPNNIGGFTTTDYAARLNRFSLVLNPNQGTASVPATTQQLQLTQSGGFLLRDTTGQVFTGRDPLNGVATRDGVAYPVVPSGLGAGKVALDAEAVSFLNDGSFYIGDEYGAGIYYFDAAGRQVGAILTNPDVIPRVNGAINFNGANDSPLVAGSTGRRSNQGMEGLSVTPDGSRLIAVLQSATLQDNPTNVAQRRNNTRVLVYDISASKTPTAPMAEYVLQLPVYNNSATGTGAASATAAQSEVLALNNTQLLVLSRDGNGRGTNGNANAIAFKSVLLVDLAGATNIAGTSYSNGTTPISTSAAANGSGALVPGIVPVQQVELVNMLNTAQLGRFGINTSTTPSTQYSLSEKWEAMGLAPTLEEDRPQDFFLFIGNDNDFVSNDIDAAGVTNANAALNSAVAGTGNNDNVINVYRLTIPTYIDPQAWAWLTAAGGQALAGARAVGAQMGAAPVLAGMDNAGFSRRARAAGIEVAGVRGWVQGDYDRIPAGGDAGAIDAGSFSVGVEAGSASRRYGFAASAGGHNGGDSPFKIDGHSYALGLYGGLFSGAGLYLQGAVGAGRVSMNVGRPASYGLQAEGRTSGRVYSANLQVGYTAALGSVRLTPFADVLYSDVSLKAYTEHGAAVGNGRMPKTDSGRTEATIGLEAAFAPIHGARPSARLGWTHVNSDDSSVVLALAAAPNSAQAVRLPVSDDSFADGQVALEGSASGIDWRAAVGVRSGDDDTAVSASLGLRKAF